MMNFSEALEFTKEFAKLIKKYPSLPQDFETFKKVLPKIDFQNHKNFAVLKEQNRAKAIKAKLKITYLKGKPKSRVIFILRIQNNSVYFLEIYTKNTKEREDRMRISDYFKKI